MFVKKLKLTNWRSHKVTDLEFGALNLIRGPNASGKTSISQALEFLLTGRCLGTDEAGRGGDALISAGTRQASIEGVISSGKGDTTPLTIARERTMAGSNCSLKMAGRTYIGRQVEEFLSKWSWSKAGSSCVLRAGRFIELPAREQKELLADILKPEPIATPPEILEAMETCFGGFEIEQVDLEGLRELEERATKLRAECTAALRELGDPGEPPANPKGTSQQVREKLDALREEQQSLARAKEKLENAWAEKNKRARELPKLIALWNDSILHEDTEKRNLETVAQETKIFAAQKEEAALGSYLTLLERDIADMENHPGICPTCQRPLDLREKLEASKARRGELAQKLAQVRSFLEGCADVGDAKVRLAAHRNAIVEKAKLEKELKDLKVGEPPDTRGKADQIAKLEERIQNGQKVLADTGRAEEALRAYQETLSQRESLNARRTAADLLAKWAGPNGAQAQMTAGKLPAFVKQVNEVLEAFGYACDIELEPYSIRAKRLGRDANLELGSLSESEKWRFSLSFQAALARATGVNCIVLDRADVLVGANRGALLKTVLSLGLDQVFLLASVEKFAPMPEAFTVFDLTLSEKGETIVTNG